MDDCLYDPTYVRRYIGNGNNHVDLATPWREYDTDPSLGFGELLASQSNWTHASLRDQQSVEAADHHVVKGAELAKAGQLKEAEECYQEALKLHPRSANAFVAIGCLFGNVGDSASAIKNFKVALSHEPGHVNATKYLDIVQMRVQAKAEEAHRIGARGTQKVLADAQVEKLLEQAHATTNQLTSYQLIAAIDVKGTPADRRRTSRRKPQVKQSIAACDKVQGCDTQWGT